MQSLVRFSVSLLTTTLFVTSAHRAFAHEREGEEQGLDEDNEGHRRDRPKAPNSSLLDLSLGHTGSSGSSVGGQLLASATGLRRLGLFEVGASLELGTAITTDHRVGASLLAGIGFHGESKIGFDALGEFGLHSYWGVRAAGIDIFEKTSGISGETPFIGFRIGANFTSGKANLPMRTIVGLWLYGRYETSQTSSNYSGTTTGWLNDTITEHGHKATIGGATEIGAALRLGFDVH